MIGEGDDRRGCVGEGVGVFCGVGHLCARSWQIRTEVEVERGYDLPPAETKDTLVTASHRCDAFKGVTDDGDAEGVWYSEDD